MNGSNALGSLAPYGDTSALELTQVDMVTLKSLRYIINPFVPGFFCSFFFVT